MLIAFLSGSSIFAFSRFLKVVKIWGTWANVRDIKRLKLIEDAEISNMLNLFNELQIGIRKQTFGGIRNVPFCQWIADSTKKSIVAGPVETSSTGNLLMQLKADREISFLDEAREISRKSSEIKYFEPINTKEWDLAFEKYLRVIEKS